MKNIFTLLCVSALYLNVLAQCPGGQSEVYIDVTTDAYGYEIYWELVPSGNGCGNGTIFSGGNNLVGCNGGSAQAQNPGGYGNMTTITEGPWCLTDNADYDIIFVDDWGDEGADFTVTIGGFPMYYFDDGTGANSGSIHTFTVELPLAYNMEGVSLANPSYLSAGNNSLEGNFYNRGTNTITSMDINYKIDNGATVTSNLTGLNIAPFTSYMGIHPTQWNELNNGNYQVKMWVSNLNGNSDMDNSNDTITKQITIGPGIPNLINDYVTLGFTPIQIAGSSDGVLVPRDLDFHPILTRNELWVILKQTENSGGKTVKISNAGLPSQTELVQQDGNAWHFMSLPTGIAFSENENFATSPGVFDANHNGGSPFTGPTLWSSDPAIYAQPSGGNGSHLDMLHESPYSMGIASEEDNIFWVTDGDSYCITYYDFKEDHGAGNSFHGDGIVRKYLNMGLSFDPAYHVVSHLVRDKNSNWLYIVDTGNDKIVRLDVTSGNVINTFTPMEAVAESSIMGNYTMEDYITTGLTEPSGIDIIEDRMVVSDHATGDIVLYDISGTTGTEIGRLQTGTPGIMGVKIGPDGKIWYVNATTNQVMRADFTVGVNETEKENSILVYPNPSNGIVNVNTTLVGDYFIEIIDISGKVVVMQKANSSHNVIDVSSFENGLYIINVLVDNKIYSSKKLNIIR